MRATLLALLLTVAMPAAAEDFRPLPLHEAARIVTQRYHGRLIGARMTLANPHERSLGALLVEELRLLTPEQNLLVIRLDARTGRFLEVAGIGQTEALKR